MATILHPAGEPPTAVPALSEPGLSPPIRRTLDDLRRRIRRYVVREGVAVAAAWLCVAFWLTLLVDWVFEPPPAARVILLLVVAGVLLAIVYRLILRRVLVPLPDASLAMLLERRFPRFDEALITTVELAGADATQADWHPQMLARANRHAAQEIDTVRLNEVFDFLPLQLRTFCAAFLLFTVGALLWGSPATASLLARRMFLLSDQLWPRRTQLTVEGFADGRLKIAKGSDLDVLAKVDLHASQFVPKSVQIRYRLEGGRADRAPMNRNGVADPRKERFQEYSYAFRGLLVPVTFDVQAGDNAVRGLRIEVVDSPTIVEMTLDCEYPAYTGLTPRQLPVTGAMQIPQGTRMVLHATANKPLARVQVDTAVEDHAGRPEVLTIDAHAAERRVFQYALPALLRDTTLQFTLTDDDGIKSREPIRLALAALHDEPPRVTAQLHGVGLAITPQARLPIAGQIADDYGIANIWFEYAVDQHPPAKLPLASPAARTTDSRLDEALEVGPLALKPGHKLLAAIKASDHYNLGSGPNIGSSERWLLDVVTPEKLRSMLENRELALRQRMEAIYQEVTETRDLLAQLEFGAPPADKPSAAPATPPAAKPSPDPDAGAPQSPLEKFRSKQWLRAQRALQNSTKNAQETLGVAEAFDDIRLQLINNRIDTEELIQRVQGGIADPLRHIGQHLFPELDQRLKRLSDVLNDEQLGPPQRNAAREQVDVILTSMRQVLNRMLELESFNEAVELLRTIITAQEQINQQTRQRHNQKLRDLRE